MDEKKQRADYFKKDNNQGLLSNHWINKSIVLDELGEKSREANA